MREIRKAMREGAKETFRAVAGLPKRHPLMIAGFLGGILLAIFLGGYFQTSNRIDRQDRHVHEISRVAAACNKHSLDHPRESRICAERLRYGFINCRRHPLCRQALLAATAPPSPSRRSENGGVTIRSKYPAEGGGAQNPGPKNPGQQPGGGGPPKKAHLLPNPNRPPQKASRQLVRAASSKRKSA